MYVNFNSDRKALKKNYSNSDKDSISIKQFKKLTCWIKETKNFGTIYIFSKGILVAIILFLKKPINLLYQPHYIPTYPPSKVLLSNSNTNYSKVLEYAQSRTNFVSKLRGGSDSFETEDQKRLVISTLSKTKPSKYSEISINKYGKRLIRLLDPFLSDQRLWTLWNQSSKPMKSQLPDLEINTPFRVRDSSRMFAEALNMPSPNLSSMQKRVQLKMAQNSFSNNLESSGLSRNHERLDKNIQSIEKETKTKLRRAKPLDPSHAMGDSYVYGHKQLERKFKHLKKFNISTVGKSTEELVIEYKDLMETILSKKGLIVHKNGTLNKQERAIIIGDPETRGIICFENNPLYNKHHFITGYRAGKDLFKSFNETGKAGFSKEERAQKMIECQKIKMQAEREKAKARLFYSNLPADARMSNRQLHEVTILQKQLKQDPSISLTEKETNMIERLEKYQQYKHKFSQDNLGIDRDDL